MIIKLLTALFVVVLAGCTQASTKAEVKKSLNVDLQNAPTDNGNVNKLIASSEQKKITCRYEKASGSNIRQRVCRSYEDRARVRENSKGFLNRIQQQPTPTRD